MSMSTAPPHGCADGARWARIVVRYLRAIALTSAAAFDAVILIILMLADGCWNGARQHHIGEPPVESVVYDDGI